MDNLHDSNEPVAWINWCAATGKRSVSFECESELASQPLYEGITQNTQYHYSKFHSWFDSELHRKKYTKDHPAYLAAQEAWNAANDAAQHRINRLNSEIEAWKVRFKIAEDALVKLSGPEQKPVAWTTWRELVGARHYGTPGWEMYANKRNIDDVPLYTSPQTAQQEPVAVYVGETWCGSVVRLYKDLPLETPLYTSPRPSKPWVGLTGEEVKHQWEIWRASIPRYVGFAIGIEDKLREKNTQPSKPLTDEDERKAFEQWYVCNAFDYERNPIGSRECGLQWSAWKAKAAHGIKEKNHG